MGHFIRRTILGGMLILVPILGALYLLGGLFRGVKKILEPLASLIPGPLGVIGKEVVAVALMALLCFLLGLIVETNIGRAIGKLTETTLLTKLPGYLFFKRIAANLAGVDKTFGKPVLVRFDDSAQFGFLIDEGDRSTVFLPSPPGIATGTILVVNNTQVEHLNVGAQEFVQSLSRWGFESQRFLTPKPPAS